MDTNHPPLSSVSTLSSMSVSSLKDVNNNNNNNQVPGKLPKTNTPHPNEKENNQQRWVIEQLAIEN